MNDGMIVGSGTGTRPLTEVFLRPWSAKCPGPPLRMPQLAMWRFWAVLIVGVVGAAKPASSVSAFPTVVVTVDTTTAVAKPSPHFVGVNTDWWLTGCGGEGKDWGDNASIAVLDLDNPRLNTLARALSGATWRIGGTHGDSVVYSMGNTTSARACTNKSPPWQHPPDCLSPAVPRLLGHLSLPSLPVQSEASASHQCTILPCGHRLPSLPHG
jgi:hypothetical protein